MISPKEVLPRVRAKRPFVDHLVRALERYLADGADRLAAAVTYYWFLSLFPMLLLAVAVLGFVLDDPRSFVGDALGGFLPSIAVDTITETLSTAKGRAGLIGFAGLLYAGLGWLDALREALRTVWHQNINVGNFLVQKLFDVVALVGLLGTIGGSIILTGLVTAATSFLVGLLGLDAKGGVGELVLGAAGLALLLVADILLFLYLLVRLPRVSIPFRRVIKGALFGAVAFEILKYLGSFYVELTTRRGAATYGTFAVVVGLLLFLNLLSRLILFTACFVVTAPYDSDVAPSGTSTPRLARKAGIPEEFVGDDPDDPPTVRKDGAPAPLLAAIRGVTPPQDVPDGPPDVDPDSRSTEK